MVNVWQVGAGDEEKDLVPPMLKQSVMMIGPGNVGDITGQSEEEVKKMVKNNHDTSAIIRFRDAAKEGEIVVLRLGSVCFAVGVISGQYKWCKEFEDVYSYWNNKGEFRKEEKSWDLQHTRKVEWFVLKSEEALCYFRRGTYGKQAFLRVDNPELRAYLERLGYDGTNGREILMKIADRTNGVNKYGFPQPA